MCFKLDLTGCSKSSFLEFITAFLEKRSAKGSDPGLCMAKLNDQLQNEKLIEFGLKAKSHVLCKSEAYNLAKETEIHLSEHGGTGIGVIGALAGIGLRLTGNDGRYRGWYHFGKPGDIVTAGSLYAYNCVDQVVTKSGRLLGTDEFLMIGSEKTKTIRMRHNQVVLACANENSAVNRGARYRTLTKDEAKAY
jgi:hypothetical protein